MEKQYKHSDHEQKIYSLWAEADAFKPRQEKDAETFTIVMPPPNANDPLHVGHAMFVTLEDILIRYQRMLGKAALWIPGTDHAGIETQFVFEKKLAKKKQSRFDFDRETLFQMIWEYVQENSDTAVDQIKQLGASADWSRFKFMLDEDIVNTVLETFQKMVDADLVYRDLRIVNYCTHCGTAFSELEVNHVEQTTKLYYIKYPKQDNPKEFITIATTRPEPIFVDTHLAVHPDNPKTKSLIGTKVLNPLTDEPMEIMADTFVDPEFGTGIVKLTPAHDPADFEVAQRHKLPIIQAIDTFGKIVKDAPKYAGMKVKQAREAAVEELEAKGLIEKVDDKYVNRIGTCYRCSRVLEPLTLSQFFIKVEPLTQPILKALKNNEIKVHGAGHDKILRHWLENLKDWNISRQIVWGIRMPVWYQIGKDKNQSITITFIDSNKEIVRGQIGKLLEKYSFEEIKNGLQSLQAPVESTYVVSRQSPGKDYLQETDTFDTWFSSAQWPFSTLLNNQPGDFERFYPTQVMETGYDILPFWVMRMLMVGTFVTGKLPFSTIYMHGLIRDQKGLKMSKSKGNVINPLEVVKEYGADALRMALVIRSTPGLDKNVGRADFKANRNLTNKIWNASRFIILNLDSDNDDSDSSYEKHYYQELEQSVLEITRQLDGYKLGLAAETAYTQFWHWFCDQQIEAHKEAKLSTRALLEGLVTFLKLLHPFIPFVTEAVYQSLKNEVVDPKLADLLQENLLIKATWPTLK